METEIAILMADLSGYTAMTEMHGPRLAAEIINDPETILNRE